MDLSYKCKSCGTVSFINMGICSVCGTFGSLRLYKREFEDFTEEKHDSQHYDRTNPKYKNKGN